MKTVFIIIVQSPLVSEKPWRRQHRGKNERFKRISGAEDKIQETGHENMTKIFSKLGQLALKSNTFTRPHHKSLSLKGQHRTIFLTGNQSRITDCLYMDYAASTPIDQRVLSAMMAVMAGDPGNPQAKHHAYGSKSSRIVEKAREEVASSIGCPGDAIVFTSGATEANNLVLKGLARSLEASGRTHILTSAVEHKSVLEPLSELKNRGFRVSVLPVKPCGMIEADAIERALDDEVGLVSIQAVNNETGTIQPLSEIARVLKARGILFHSDATQALGKTDFDVVSSGVDFASLSAHKVYGPQGIGALFADPRKKSLLQSRQTGGGQEWGLRSGTVPVALCAGFGAACSIIEDERERLKTLRDSFLTEISPLNPTIHGHSDSLWNVPGIISIRFPGIDNETLLMALSGLAVGTGSACSANNNSSHVIAAITGSKLSARETIRLSFGRFTTIADMSTAAAQITEAVTQIRHMEGDL